MTAKSNVCCPSVMNNGDRKTYCCIGDTNNGCGQVTCFKDPNSCQHTVDVDSPDYKDHIQNLTGTKPPNPGGSSGSGSGSSSLSGESGYSSATRPFDTPLVRQVFTNYPDRCDITDQGLFKAFM
ncbi:hypothetical protein V8C35DRAFT_280992 [Trichoderma chlorosporum]